MTDRRRAASRTGRFVAAMLGAVILAGCSSARSVSSPSLAPSLLAHGESTQGQFQVVFDLPKTVWRAGESLTGRAQLRFLGQDSTTISHNESLFGFEVAEVGGDRRVQPIWATSCREETISAAAPISAGLEKSGGLDTDFAKTFLSAAGFELPPGVWDISAIAPFDPVGCGQLEGRPPGVPLRVTVRVQVVANS